MGDKGFVASFCWHAHQLGQTFFTALQRRHGSVPGIHWGEMTRKITLRCEKSFSEASVHTHETPSTPLES